jgi:hypothetical protein
MTKLENKIITEDGCAVINIVLTCYWKTDNSAWTNTHIILIDCKNISWSQ